MPGMCIVTTMRDCVTDCSLIGNVIVWLDYLVRSDMVNNALSHQSRDLCHVIVETFRSDSVIFVLEIKY